MLNKTWINIIGFQSGWWGLVLSASQGEQHWGLIGMGLLITLHFAFFSENRHRDLYLLKAVAALGIAVDLLLIQVGLMDYPAAHGFPYWLLGLWFLFPLTLPYSFKPWLEKNWCLPLLAIGAALSYLAGESFKVLSFPHGIWLSAALLSLVWLAHLWVFRRILRSISQIHAK